MLTEYEHKLFGESYAELERGMRLDAGLARALDALAEWYGDEKLSVMDLARAAGMSATVLRERFRRVAGMTPRKFIIRYRILRALSMLRMHQNNISEIAASVGFANIGGLERGFRSALGASPRQVSTCLRSPTEEKAGNEPKIR